MKTSQEHNWNIPQRQARAGLLVIMYKAILTVIRIIWPLLLVVVFREQNKRFDTLEMLLIGLPALILIRSLIDFFYFRFYISNDDLIIKKGFLSRKLITIPIRKIQSVHIQQNLVHQLLNVAKLTIDTAGSEKAEAEIDAISIRKAGSFRQFLLENERSLADEETHHSNKATGETPLIQFSFGDLIKLGLSANHIQAFFILIAFSISMLQNLKEIFGDRVLRMVAESSSEIALSMISVLMLFVFVLLISVIVSVIRTILKYANFTCSETEQGYRIHSGLIDSRQNIVPFSKIQYISWEANWIRKKIGLYLLEFHQAQNEQAKKKQRIRLPISKRGYVDKLLQHYHPVVKPVAHSVHEIDKVYPFRRMLLTGLPTAMVFTAVAFLWFKWYALFLLLWAPYRLVVSIIYRNRFRLYISPEAFQINSGIWGKESKVAQWYKIQYLELRQSMYQRRRKLSTIIIHTAGGKIIIPYVSLELAHAVQNYALYKVERSEQSWIG